MIRITAHPHDQAFLVLRVDQRHNPVIGSFQPARRQDDMGVGVYVMEASLVNQLKAWARLRDIHLLNEVRDKAEPTHPIECGNTVDPATREVCCAPYPAGRIPSFCGACGQPAKPVTYGENEPDIGAKCPGCGRVNHGGGRYCVACGSGLPERHLSAPVVNRIKGEPVSLGEAIAAMPELHPATEETA